MEKKLSRIEIVVPIYNEEKELKENILKLYTFAEKHLQKYDWKIIIADNASTDRSSVIGKSIGKKYRRIDYFYLPEKGRGRAVRKAWRKNNADIYIYMDLDLSTDLSHLPGLIRALQNGYDIAIGTRLKSDSRVVGRTLKREIMSRGYNILIKFLFGTHFSDAQCGFKGVTSRVVQKLLPFIHDNEWFFDSELLIVGEKSGLKIFEEPILWVDNPGSTVRVLKTVMGDLRGLLKLFVTQPWRRISHF